MEVGVTLVIIIITITNNQLRFSSQYVKTFLLRAFGWLGLKSPLLTLSWLTKHDTIIRNIAGDKNRCCQNQVIFIQRDMLLIY